MRTFNLAFHISTKARVNAASLRSSSLSGNWISSVRRRAQREKRVTRPGEARLDGVVPLLRVRSQRPEGDRASASGRGRIGNGFTVKGECRFLDRMCRIGGGRGGVLTYTTTIVLSFWIGPLENTNRWNSLNSVQTALPSWTTHRRKQIQYQRLHSRGTLNTEPSCFPLGQPRHLDFTPSHSGPSFTHRRHLHTRRPLEPHDSLRQQ